jgi:hypothetical protein
MLEAGEDFQISANPDSRKADGDRSAVFDVRLIKSRPSLVRDRDYAAEMDAVFGDESGVLVGVGFDLCPKAVAPNNIHAISRPLHSAQLGGFTPPVDGKNSLLPKQLTTRSRTRRATQLA